MQRVSFPERQKHLVDAPLRGAAFAAPLKDMLKNSFWIFLTTLTFFAAPSCTLQAQAVPAPPTSGAPTSLLVASQTQERQPRLATKESAANSSDAIRVATRLVILDIVVTDKKGNIVDDLTKNDFVVTEEDQPQRIRTLERPIVHKLPAGDIVHSSADLGKIGESPVNILVLDELNTRFEDNAYSRHSMLKFLKAQPDVMPPTTLLVANDQRFIVMHDYTQDRSAIEAALKQAPVQYPWRLARNGNSGPDAIIRMAQSLQTLQEIAQSAAGTPGRKNILWVGKGFPSLDLTGMADEVVKPLEDAIKRCVDLLMNSRTTLYVIDPTPLSSATYDTEVPQDLATLEDETGDEPFGNAIRFSVLAPATGGRVFSMRNDIDHEIDTSMHDSSQYYTLSYSPGGASDEPGAYRHIRVTLNRPGLTATTRDGYYVQTPEGSADVASDTLDMKQAMGEHVMDVANAVMNKLVYNGLKVRAGKVTPERFSLAVEDSSLVWKSAPDEGSQAAISITAVCFSAKNKVLSHITEDRFLTNKAPGSTPAAQEVFTVPIDLPTGTTRLRFVIRDAATGHLGTADLNIP
jgi:VWFA-related protein